MAPGHSAENNSKVGPTGVTGGANSDVREDQEKGVSRIAILGLSGRCHSGEDKDRPYLAAEAR